MEVIADVGRRDAFILQRDLEEFERDLARYLGAKHVVGMANATDALHLAMRAAGLGPGDEVIFCSHTMVATAAAIHFAGATPLPVECGPDHLIDPAVGGGGRHAPHQGDRSHRSSTAAPPTWTPCKRSPTGTTC